MKINTKKKEAKPVKDLRKLGPLIFPKDMTKTELIQRLRGGRKFMGITSGGIIGYNKSMVEAGMPQHCMTRRQLEAALERSGFDPKLADKVFNQSTE